MSSVHRPYQDNLSALIHEPTFENAASEAIFGKSRLPRVPLRAVRSLSAGARQANGPAVADVGEEAVRMHGEGWPPSGRRCLPEGLPVDPERSIDVPTALAELFDPDLHLDLRSWHLGRTRYLFSRPITPRET